MKTIYQKLLFLLLLLPFSVLAQSTLDGTVVDNASKQPIPGVNVVIKGSGTGTQTDFDGKFKLSDVKKGDVIVFSYLGYTDSSVTYDSQSNVSVSLQEEANQLSEVVVQVGYGTVKKKDATGSVTTLSTKEFNKGANVTAENLLSGRVAGVTVNTSGAPGSGSQIRIRGGSSLTASNDPLIVIDGLPIQNGDAVKGSTSVLAALNPNDIESMTVLKDASATAIYGSRASNGVIIITTKRGSKTLAVDYNVQYGSGKVVKTVDVLTADEFRAAVNREKPADAALLGNANTDWQKEIYRRTDFIDNNISVRGNLFGAIPARLSLGNTYQEGLRLTNTFNRNTIATSLNPSFFTDHLKIKVNATYAGERNRFTEGVEGAAVRFDPTQPVYDPNSPFDGFYEHYDASGHLVNGSRNPVAQLLQTNDTGKNRRIFGNVEVDYKLHFFPELRAIVNLGFDESNGERRKIVPGRIAGSGASNGTNIYGANEYGETLRRTKLFDSYLNYNKTLGKLNIDATAGYSYQIYSERKIEYGNVNDPNLPANFPEVGTETDNVLIGLFARANFSYNDKYLLTFSFRRDASSRYPEDNRWGNFPAAAFAWKVNQEFFKDSKTVSDLKLRLGYGTTGQQVLPSDANNYYLQQYSIGSGTSQYYFGNDAIPIAISKPLNPFLKWEETTTYNVGLDYGLFNNRITGALDVFYKETDDLIVKAVFADGANFSNVGYQNIGSFTTKGIEFSVNAAVAKSQNFNWDVNFNVSTYEREITELDADSDIYFGDAGAGTGTLAQVHRVGYTPGSFYVYKQLYDQAGQPIEGAYADLNGDGTLNESDRYIYNNPDPDATFGFASNMNYKNIDFSFNLRASVGNRLFNAVNASKAQYDLLKDNSVLGNIPSQVLDTNFNTTSNVILSDVYVENASFLRMDNVTLGYTFPKWLEGKASLRFFAGVQNAFVITDYSGIDPEVTDGRDNTIYPRQRTILLGANVKF